MQKSFHLLVNAHLAVNMIVVWFLKTSFIFLCKIIIQVFFVFMTYNEHLFFFLSHKHSHHENLVNAKTLLFDIIKCRGQMSHFTQIDCQ